MTREQSDAIRLSVDELVEVLDAESLLGVEHVEGGAWRLSFKLFSACRALGLGFREARWFWHAAVGNKRMGDATAGDAATIHEALRLAALSRSVALGATVH